MHKRRTILFGLYLAALTAVSLAPPSAFPVPPRFPGADKIAHLGMYAGLATLLRWSLSDGTRCRSRTLVTIAILSGYGLLMEIGQHTLTTRTFEWLDVAANALGATLGWRLSRRIPRD